MRFAVFIRNCLILFIVGGALLIALLIAWAPQWSINAETQPEPQSVPARPISITAVGDIMLARGVGQQISRHGAGYPFEYSRELLPESDLTFANLESPISDRGVPVCKAYVFRARPIALDGLVDAGFNVVSLSNNHSLDWGRVALMDTLERLENAGIAAAGAGRNMQLARSPAVLNAHGTRVAFLAYCDLFPMSYYARADEPSIAPADPKTLPDDIAEARKRADLVVVSFHWGVEYRTHSNVRQQHLAHLAIDSGADLVLGHHPHVLQEIESYKGRVIAYSLGNFIFDQRDRTALEGAALQIELTPGRSELLRVIPFEIQHYQPRPADPEAEARILARLQMENPRIALR